MKVQNTSGAGSKSTTREKIDDMLAKIETEELLVRIYQFIKYIYIHKT